MAGTQAQRPLSKSPPDVVAVPKGAVAVEAAVEALAVAVAEAVVAVHLRPMAPVLVYRLTALMVSVAVGHCPLGGWWGQGAVPSPSARMRWC
jgi:hypothetical protein